MKVSLLSSVDEYLSRTENFRRSNPEVTNVISGVAQQVSVGERSYDQYFWWVAEDSDQVIGIGMRTAPHGLLISPMPNSAATKLAQEVAEHDPQISAVSGPIPTIHAFIEEYRKLSPTEIESKIEKVGHDLLYALGELTPMAAEGEMVEAKEENFTKILTWFRDFANEAGIVAHNPAESIEDGLRRNSWRFWINNGEIVSMAGHAPIVEIPGGTVARIGPVYTPPNLRRRGYAGALTARFSQELSERGSKVILYTDASNPTSNSIYQKIGYRKIGENERYSFVAAP